MDPILLKSSAKIVYIEYLKSSWENQLQMLQLQNNPYTLE